MTGPTEEKIEREHLYSYSENRYVWYAELLIAKAM